MAVEARGRWPDITAKTFVRTGIAPGAAVPGWVHRTVFVTVSMVVVIPSLLPFISIAPDFNGYGGIDFQLYVDAASRWVGGDAFYPREQVVGPYALQMGGVLYPPVALWLFVPFTVLPAVLWWAIPLAVTAWCVWLLRPSQLTWPLLAMCVAWPPTLVKLATGNPVMWVMAAMALGVVTAGPAVLVLLKPSLIPFAVWGVRHRPWWRWLAAFLILSAPFGAMWAEWVATVANAKGGGLLYSIQEVPMLLIPVIAWLGRTRRRATAPRL